MQMKESKYAKIKGNLCKVKVDMDNYRFYLLARVQNFKSTEPDFSSLFHSSGASIGPGDGDLDGCICFSCHSKLEHCSSLGLKVNRSSFPLIWNLISLALTSMCALVVLRKGLLSMRGVFMSSYMSSTTKSTRTKKFLIFTRIFSAVRLFCSGNIQQRDHVDGIRW